MASNIKPSGHAEEVTEKRELDSDMPLESQPEAGSIKSRWERTWPTIACGAGLFSDGYLNGVIGSVNTMLGIIYKDAYTNSPAQQNVSSIAFAGTVVGQLFFGALSDYWSRKNSLLIATVILFVFAALSAGAYGADGSPYGLFAAITAYRFLIGIGIGAEYPAGSVAAAENARDLKSGHRNHWFIFFTDFTIDFAFVVAAFVPMVLVLIFGENNLGPAWRLSFGLGVVPPLSLLYLRLKLKEPEEYNRHRMHMFPYGLIIRFYWWRLLVISLIWFMYDFSVYSFGIYSSVWLKDILGDKAPLWKTFAWNTVINMFYMPGSFAGAFVSDWIGPGRCLALGVGLQAIVGFAMAGCYKYLSEPQNVAAFVVVYGVFLALGELGPGDNIGLIAAKSSATAVRGQFYGVAASAGKIGAFIGTYVFPIIQKNAGPKLSVPWGQHPFWVSSALCVFSAFLAYFCVPHLGQDIITEEDEKFREYLEANGYDTSTMGTKE